VQFSIQVVRDIALVNDIDQQKSKGSIMMLPFFVLVIHDSLSMIPPLWGYRDYSPRMRGSRRRGCDGGVLL
jgi:hypothetical protein